jgi:mRNA interferase MazF
MVIERGEIWWADLPEPIGSGPGYRRPVLIIQADTFNNTNLNTSIVALITAKIDLAEMKGNVLLKSEQSDLPKDSVVNVTQIFTIDKRLLLECVSIVSERKMEQVEKGLRLVLEL